jgi:Ca2+/Na+ antiporter
LPDLASLTSWLKEVSTQPAGLLFWGVAGLLLSTQIVVLLLDRLEKAQFGSVQLGTLMTPLCTGFPNIAIGLLGADRLADDLVLQLNIGNNLANTTLVIGLVTLLAGPLALARKSKREAGIWLGLLFLWLGSAWVLFLARDGRMTRLDGLLCLGVYAAHHVLALRQRGKVSARKKLGPLRGFTILLLLLSAGFLIHRSLGLIGAAMEGFSGSLGPRIGLFLGLLTVLPECFLLLRLALQQGRLGLSGIVGDCLVSIPLVIGLSACLKPFPTPLIQNLGDASAWSWIYLGGAMLFFTGACLAKNLPRLMGLPFIALYAIVWWHANHGGSSP